MARMEREDQLDDILNNIHKDNVDPKIRNNDDVLDPESEWKVVEDDAELNEDDRTDLPGLDEEVDDIGESFTETSMLHDYVDSVQTTRTKRSVDDMPTSTDEIETSTVTNEKRPTDETDMT